MVDNTPSPHARKVGGVRFSHDATGSSSKDDETPHKTNELQWEQCCDTDRTFNLYFGILKLSHIYSMTMDVIFHQSPMIFETILDQQDTRGLQLLVTEFPQSHSEHRTSFEVEIVINPESLPGPFHRTFLLRDTSRSQQRSVTVNVSGKILRQGQGTATLRDGVHMKSIIMEKKDDEE